MIYFKGTIKRMAKTKYILDWVKDFLNGQTPEEVGLSEADLKKLIGCYENNVNPAKTHFQSLPTCACNICRS